MREVRIQIGHQGRKTGSTGAYNSSLRISEVGMNEKFANAIQAAWDQMIGESESIRLRFISADERPYSPCDMFLALHMDGSGNKSADGPSNGYAPWTKTNSLRFIERWMGNRNAVLPPPPNWRSHNYTTGLSGYYGYKESYSSGAEVRVVIENGFTTNNAEVQEVAANMEALGKAMVQSIREYALGAWSLSLPLPSSKSTKSKTGEVTKTVNGEELALIANLRDERDRALDQLAKTQETNRRLRARLQNVRSLLKERTATVKILKEQGVNESVQLEVVIDALEQAYGEDIDGDGTIG